MQKIDKYSVDQKLENAKRKLHQGYQQAENGELFSTCVLFWSFLVHAFLRRKLYLLLAFVSFSCLALLFCLCLLHFVRVSSFGLMPSTNVCVAISAKKQRVVQVLDIPDLPKTAGQVVRGKPNPPFLQKLTGGQWGQNRKYNS